MIRQAISCDVCGRDKQQTNHWFVVYEHGAELRISGWNVQARTSTKAKHLCGHTCLHKLVDDFMARTVASRSAGVGEESLSPADDHSIFPGTRTDDSLTSAHTYPAPTAGGALSLRATNASDRDSAARLIPPVSQTVGGEKLLEGQPAYKPSARRAEAWKREQEREKRSRQNPRTSGRSIA